jgi:hypothetical protein
MTDLTKLSGPKLRAIIAKRETERNAALDATIAAGMGQMRHADIVELSNGSPLLVNTQIARTYLTTRQAWLEAMDELDDRKRYHGSDKPIKRKF